MREIVLGSDHWGIESKNALIHALEKERNFLIEDLGAYGENTSSYPEFGHKVAKWVEDKNIVGILMCKTGNGMAMVANRYDGVRAALCWDEEIARLARRHNDANILCLPVGFLTHDQMINITKVFLKTSFEKGRHVARVRSISRLCEP
ncbi:MAG: RpiB/LacA/LacB family sugar-phosphate isomerase [Cytophagales bacterium]|nr:RpiB/LacA/LacB family sugar-phosphate isomerase [Cytophagales bacterium]